MLRRVGRTRGHRIGLRRVERPRAARSARCSDGYALVSAWATTQTWSLGQREAVERFVRGGGNFATFSGNTMFWQVRLEPLRDLPGRLDGAPTSTACRRDRPGDGSRRGAHHVGHVGRSRWSAVRRRCRRGFGVRVYSRFGRSTPRGSGAFTVYRDDHWLFEGTELRYGDLLGVDDGAAGYETVGCRLTFDEYQLPVAAGGDGTPADVEVVAFTPATSLRVGVPSRSPPRTTRAPSSSSWPRGRSVGSTTTRSPGCCTATRRC